MPRFAIVYNLSAGRERRHIVEAWITDVPPDVKAAEIVERLEGSRFSAEFSERGVFLGNRRVLSEAQMPKGATEAAELRNISWPEVAASSSAAPKQLNVRVPPAKLARYQRAAAAAGMKMAPWVTKALDDASEGL